MKHKILICICCILFLGGALIYLCHGYESTYCPYNAGWVYRVD